LIIKIKFYVLLVLLAVAGLRASSCFDPGRLYDWADRGIAPEIHFNLAAKQGNTEAESRLLVLAKQSENTHWLELLASSGHPEAHFELALRAERPSLKNYHLLESAKYQFPQAMYELGIAEFKPNLKVHYLQVAAEAGHKPAQKALYKWYWFQEQYHLGLPWLKKVAEQEPTAALELALHLWRQEEPAAATSWLNKSKELGSKDAQSYLSLIAKYASGRGTANKPQYLSHNNDCVMRLQFVATNLDSIRQADAYAQQFLADERLASLPICLNKPIWLEQNTLECESRAANNYRITCSLASLNKVLAPDTFTHLVVFAEQGKANVVNGVMYLDLADKYSVFVHELAHFVGFIDEYPISPGFAEFFCSGLEGFPNIAVLPKGESLENLDLSSWQNTGNDLAIVKANTCNNHSAQAYKFSEKLTFMEYHDTEFIPQLYLDIWHQRLTDRTNLRHAAINIAQALEDIGNYPAAEKWWLHFDSWRDNGLGQQTSH